MNLSRPIRAGTQILIDGRLSFASRFSLVLQHCLFLGELHVTCAASPILLRCMSPEMAAFSGVPPAGFL